MPLLHDLLDRAWQLTGGKLKAQPLDFNAIRLPSTPNYFIAGPENTFPNLPIKMTTPKFGCSVGKLRSTSRDTWLRRDTVELAAEYDDPPQDCYVHRSEILRFPDMISVQFVELDKHQSSLIIYSRSQVGYSDLGANKQRVKKWLKDLETHISTP